MPSADYYPLQSEQPGLAEPRTVVVEPHVLTQQLMDHALVSQNTSTSTTVATPVTRSVETTPGDSGIIEVLIPPRTESCSSVWEHILFLQEPPQEAVVHDDPLLATEHLSKTKTAWQKEPDQVHLDTAGAELEVKAGFWMLSLQCTCHHRTTNQLTLQS